eukprot:TRINITY_DN31319_c1_g1_i1.p2 TRINITY_DN31319_c1_g1~~TRINITY_DN31319_c1_g1_i1.p2  ORF type:complete len:226 (-),score=22.41 TRINITY_DN31319_c1_g1_i1:504-1181(-)
MQCEGVSLDMSRCTAQYTVLLTQAHIMDDALERTKADNGKLLEAIGALAYVWTTLDGSDKFRLNEVLLVMSTLIYHIVACLERCQAAGQGRISECSQFISFESARKYFWLLLHAVEWPRCWADPLMERVKKLHPTIGGPDFDTLPWDPQPRSEVQQGHKMRVKEHRITLQQQRYATSIEHSIPEPGRYFFDRHRSLFEWAMTNDEAVAKGYVLSQLPPEWRERLG